jgi:ribosomal-protein-alanine N-acetyltransferase
MRFGGNVLSRDAAAAFLERLLAPTRLGKPSQFAVLLRGNERVLGYCGFFLQMVDDVEELEIGYRLDPEFWGNGIATEAARAVRDHAFRDLEVARVISLIHPDNEASRRVAEKNGMSFEKHTTFKTFPTNVYVLDRAGWERIIATNASSY